MMSIPCPCCGPRNQDEFSCGGQAHIQRPAEPAQVSDQAWAGYLFVRDNPRGVLLERWLHLYGCGVWFHMARDTVTHQVIAVYGINDRPPVNLP